MLASSQPLLVRQVAGRFPARSPGLSSSASPRTGWSPRSSPSRHELIVLGTAHLVGDLAWLVATGGLLRAVPLDPIYTSAMLLTLGGIEPRGLALAGPAGALLHERWPSLCRVADAGRVARLGQRGRRAGLHRRQSLALRHRGRRGADRSRPPGDPPGAERARLARRLRRHRPGPRRRHPPDRASARARRRRGGRHPVRRRDDRLRRRPGRPAPGRDARRAGRPACRAPFSVSAWWCSPTCRSRSAS